jgi:hypothetical protein
VRQHPAFRKELLLKGAFGLSYKNQKSEVLSGIGHSFQRIICCLFSFSSEYPHSARAGLGYFLLSKRSREREEWVKPCWSVELQLDLLGNPSLILFEFHFSEPALFFRWFGPELSDKKSQSTHSFRQGPAPLFVLS